MSILNVGLPCFLEMKRRAIESLKTSLYFIQNGVLKHIKDLEILKTLFEKLFKTALNFNRWAAELHESLVNETISMFQDRFISLLVDISDKRLIYLDNLQHEYKSLMLYNVQSEHKIKLKEFIDDVQSQISENTILMHEFGIEFQSLFYEFEGNVRSIVTQLEEFEKKKSRFLMEIRTALNADELPKTNSEYVAAMRTFETLNQLCIIRHKVALNANYLVVLDVNSYSDEYKAAYQILNYIDFDLLKSMQNSNYYLNEDTASGIMNTLCLDLDMLDIVNEIKDHFMELARVQGQIETELQNIASGNDTDY